MIGDGPRVDARYRVVGRLGGGGMADVYDAVDAETGVPVAIKVLRGVDNVADARRFAGEIRTTAKLAHPCIVALLDAGEHDGAPYLVMERIDGGSLQDRLREGQLPADETARVGAQVAAALAHAHDLGVVHRDVKPANVLLDEQGRARLADFGIAVSATATRLTVSGSVAGSAAYIAPEQVLGHPVSPGTDVYALGLVLLECLLGRPVYSGTAVEAALSRLTRDPDLPPDLPPEWERLLRAMTARKPEKRPSADNAAQILAELATRDPVFITLPPDVPSESLTTPSLDLALDMDVSPKRRWRGRVAVLLGGAIAAVFVAGVGALAVPGLGIVSQTPTAGVASVGPDAWAFENPPAVPVIHIRDTFNEDEVLRELRRWAATHPTRTVVKTRVVRVKARNADTPAVPTSTASATTSSTPDTGSTPDTKASAPDVADVTKTVDDTVDDVEQALPLPDVHVPEVSEPTAPVTDPVDTTVDNVHGKGNRALRTLERTAERGVKPDKS